MGAIEAQRSATVCTYLHWEFSFLRRGLIEVFPRCLDSAYFKCHFHPESAVNGYDGVSRDETRYGMMKQRYQFPHFTSETKQT